MEENHGLLISRADHERLSLLISHFKSETVDLLQLELDRARIVESDEALRDVVSMNSTVEYEEMDNGKRHQVTLVFPQSASIEESKISVLAPIGAALIGLRVGQSISWPLPNGQRKKIKVLSVVQNLT